MIEVYTFKYGKFPDEMSATLVIDVTDNMQIYDLREKFLSENGGSISNFIGFLFANGVKVITKLDTTTVMRLDNGGNYPEMARIVIS